MNNERGFTLLELMMVVIIMAILAAIALPQYFRTVTRSRTGQIITALGTLRGSVLRFQAANNNALPANITTLTDVDASQISLPAGWGVPTLTAAGSVVSTHADVGQVGVVVATGVVCCANATNCGINGAVACP